MSETLENIVENFSLFDDWEDRYRYLIDLGRGLPHMEEALRTDSHIVRGCTSRVWLVSVKRADGTFHFEADSDARERWEQAREVQLSMTIAQCMKVGSIEIAACQAHAMRRAAPELRGDPAHLRRMMMEEWIARRLSSPHVLKAVPPARPRRYLYVVTEHVEGRTLRQWMHDNPQRDLAAVRDIAGQIARGIRAFHRRGMVHQDLRPENVMIDRTGTVKLIDFGSVRIAGVAETVVQPEAAEVLGAVQYVAPELFLGAAGSWRSDLYALGVIVYEMLTGRLPYGAAAARARSRAAQRRLVYASAQHGARPVPEWMDAALRRAVDPDPRRRQEALSEFVADLSRPDRRHAVAPRPPLAECDPVRFWQIVSLCLAGVIVYLLAR